MEAKKVLSKKVLCSTIAFLSDGHMTFSTLFGIRLNILKKEGHSVVSRFEDNLGDNDTNGGSKYAQV